MSGLGRLWRGELPLADAFWTWGVFGGLIVNGVTSVLFMILLMNQRPVTALFLGYGLSVPYNLAVTMGVWRSAAHYQGDRRLADLARTLTVVGMLVLSIT